MIALSESEHNPPTPDGQLQRGDAALIARRLKMSVQHVSEVIKGNRPGSAKLLRAIAERRAFRAEQAARLAAKLPPAAAPEGADAAGFPAARVA